MDFPDGFDPARFLKIAAKNGHNGLIGTRYRDHGVGWCTLELPYQEKLARDAASGILASGPIFTLMDMVASFSIWLKSGQFRPQATLDLRIDYLRPAKPGNTVTGRAECYHLTRSVAFVRGQAHDGDPEKPVAHMTGTYFFTASA